MLEESVLQLGGAGIAVLILYDGQKRIAVGLEKLAEKVDSCPLKK